MKKSTGGVVKEKIDMDLGRSLGHFSASMILKNRGSELELSKLDARCLRIDALLDDPKAGALYKLNGLLDPRLLMEAVISHQHFEKAASNLASVILKKGYSGLKSRAFLYYYMSQVNADPRWNAVRSRMALAVSDAFEKEAEALVSTPNGQKLNSREQEWILCESYSRQTYGNRPPAETFEKLAEACLQLSERSIPNLIELIENSRSRE
jgi:hypothetical protein